MKNPFTDIIENTGKTKSDLLEDELLGIVTGTTFYGLLDERGIPSKTQWETIQKVAGALGYEVVFQRISNSE